MQVQRTHGLVGRRILHLALGLVFTTGLLVGLVRKSYGGGCTPSEEETKWSKYKACSKQYEDDTKTCNDLPDTDKALKNRCHDSASQRLGRCDKSKGKELNAPPLIVR